MRELAWWCFVLTVLTACVPPYVAPTRDTGVVNDLVSDVPVTDTPDVQDVVDAATGNDLGEDRVQTPDVPPPTDTSDVPDVFALPDASDVPDASDALQDVPCPRGQMRCGDGMCIDPDFSDAHCGGCERPACTVGRVCRVGRCVVPPSRVALGVNHGCLLVTSAGCPNVYCWGDDRSAQLGVRSLAGSIDGGAATDGGTADVLNGCAAPVQLSAGRVIQVAAGEEHTCVLVEDGTVWCWGDNSAGQLGTGMSGSASRTPVRALLPVTTRFVQISTAFYHTCALSAAGQVWCWGAHGYGQLGSRADVGDAGVANCGADASYRGSCDPLPRRVTEVGVTISQVSAGGVVTCALAQDGRVACWGGAGGYSWTRHSLDAADGVVNAVKVSAGDATVCVLREDGNVFCWGQNNQCKLGRATAAADPTPASVAGATPSIRVEVSSHLHGCALRELGGGVRQAVCWGHNGLMQLSNRTDTPVRCGSDAGVGGHPQPVEVMAPADFTAIEEIAVGGDHSCALLRNGQLWCWGYNAFGQLGNCGHRGNSAVPLQVRGLCGG